MKKFLLLILVVAFFGSGCETMKENKRSLADSQAREQSAIMQGVQREKDTLILTFKTDVLFDKNSSAIKPNAYGSGEIDRVAQILNRYPDTTIKVVALYRQHRGT